MHAKITRVWRVHFSCNTNAKLWHECKLQIALALRARVILLPLKNLLVLINTKLHSKSYCYQYLVLPCSLTVFSCYLGILEIIQWPVQCAFFSGGVVFIDCILFLRLPRTTFKRSSRAKLRKEPKVCHIFYQANSPNSSLCLMGCMPGEFHI